MSEPFSSEHLTLDQQYQGYKAALARLEALRFDAHLNVVAGVEDAGEKHDQIVEARTRVEADLAAWQAAHPEFRAPEPEKRRIPTALRKPEQDPSEEG